MGRPCGTEAAYYRHRFRGEEPCDIDREAVNAAATRRRRAKGVKPLPKAKHGTPSKYAGGCRCVFCRDAQAEYMRSWRSGKPKTVARRESKAWKLREDVLDRVSLDGWVTAAMLAMESGRNVQAVQRVLRGLRDDGLVESRVVQLAYATDRAGMEARLEWRAT